MFFHITYNTYRPLITKPAHTYATNDQRQRKQSTSPLRQRQNQVKIKTSSPAHYELYNYENNKLTFIASENQRFDVRV